jgi:hypothetical protein
MDSIVERPAAGPQRERSAIVLHNQAAVPHLLWRLAASCQQNFSSNPTRSLTSPHGALSRSLRKG